MRADFIYSLPGRHYVMMVTFMRYMAKICSPMFKRHGGYRGKSSCHSDAEYKRCTMYMIKAELGANH